MKFIWAAALGSLTLSSFATTGDTLRFHSAVFGTERTVVVHLPEFHRYASAEVRMPVIIVLDGQHDRFVEPVLNDIRYLTCTKEIPQCITVVVPHEDRVRESWLPEGEGPEPALLRMLVEELPGLLAKYHTGDVQLLIGHSFTASFALYAFAKYPQGFPVVLAHTPGNGAEEHLPRVADALRKDADRAVYVSVGGSELQKDIHHHRWLTKAVEGEGLPGDLSGFVFREFPSAAHHAVPIRATPEFLSHCFHAFSMRDTLVPVDMNYQLKAPPPTADELLHNVAATLAWRGGTVPWELPEINGMASRLMSGDHPEQLLAVYRLGAELYPNYWEFHAAVGELVLDKDPCAARTALLHVLRLLDSEEQDLPERMEIKGEIEGLLR